MENLSVTKLDLIAYLVNLKDEAILNELVAVMCKHKNSNPSNTKLSKQDLVNRALQSNKDYEAGNYIKQEQLDLDSEKW